MMKKLASALFLLALIPAASADSLRDAFVSHCTDETATTGIPRQSAADICACTFDKISSRYGSNWPQTLSSQDIDKNPELLKLIDDAPRQCVSRHLRR